MAVKKNSKRFRKLFKLKCNKNTVTPTGKGTVNTFNTRLPNEIDAGLDIDTKKQIRYGTKSQVAWGIFSEYCDKTTIHGLKYLGEQKRPALERLFWISVFISSIYSCAVLTVNVWNKWHNNPVIVSFAEKATPVWEIPFPAVTMCSEKKYDKDVFDFKKALNKVVNKKKLANKEAIRLDVVGQVCNNFDFGDPPVTGNLYANASELIRAMYHGNPISTVYWSHKEVVGSEIFRKVLTEEGVCYTFNNFDLKEIYREEFLIEDFYFKNELHVIEYDDIEDEIWYDYPFNDTIEWNLEDGYSPDAGSKTFPRRVLRNSAKDRLFLELSDFYQDHIRCEERAPGFKLVLHTPGEIPRVSEQYIPIAFKQIVRISINPIIMKTSEGLKDYDPMRRFCYFQNERYLRYFKIYTQSNCKLECLSNFTLNRCGCVKFSMPRTISTLVCGQASIDCMKSAESELVAKEFNLTSTKPKQASSNTTSCNCLPECTSISYKAEISQGNTEYTAPKIDELCQYKTPLVSFDNLTVFSIEEAEVSIFFKEEHLLTLQRSELYGTTDFLANCGGILGLFMGVSMLSIAELVYFCSVRLATNLIVRRKKRLELNRRRHEEAIEVEIEVA